MKEKLQALLKIAFTAIAFGISFYTVAQPGSPDISFGINGKVTTSVSPGYEQGHAIAVQSDGKILVAGYGAFGFNEDFVIARYTTTGALDLSFDGDGIVTTDVGSNDNINAIAIQPDGKIVVAGTSYVGGKYVFALARYTTSGALDVSFDGDGIVTTIIGIGAYAYDLAIQTDGKIVVAGERHILAALDFALARYNTDGSLDLSFDGDGIVITEFEYNQDDGIRGVAIQPDGKIVVAGYFGVGFGGYQFGLARYTASGALDPTFDGDGIVITPSFDDGFAYDVAIQPDGKIVAAGYAVVAPNYKFALARYTSTGELDISFDTDGKVTTSISMDNDIARSVVIQADGKIIAGGTAEIGPWRDFALVRYTASGALDSSFDTDGKTTLNFGGDDNGFGLALSGNRIYMAGFTGASFALAAFNNDGLPLPLSLLSFTANKTGSSVQLKWQTTSEQNTASFILERSFDGRAFSSIGNVPAAGNSSSLLNYSFTDTKPATGINYYRLKMIDINGSFSYSKTGMVRFSGDIRLQVFPNPVTDVLNIQATGNEIATLQITDAAGKILQQQKAALTGNTFLTMDVRLLPRGTYYLILQNGSHKEVAEFIK